MMSSYRKITMLCAVLVISVLFETTNGLFEFDWGPSRPRGEELNSLKSIPDSKYASALAMGVNSIGGVQSLENNLSGRGVYVKNGSISHKQLIETLPNENAQQANIIARKILKASQYIYNTECIQRNISPVACAQFLSQKPLPSDSTNLQRECAALVDNKDGNHVFRRLLPSNYKDGLYVMNDKLVSPRKISNTALHGTSSASNDGNHNEDMNSKNLALVQWTQFIEHDLSKPVVSSLQDGQPIECCSVDNFVNSPRNLHPDCAPLIGTNPLNKYSRETCLNYVRSALSIQSCTFGPAQQLNQASGFLDLSQLYGFTRKSQNGMRAFRDGKLKTSTEGLLPLADGENRNSFCAIKLEANEICFMAGDSRVNSNPYSIILYTLFLRLHNSLAEEIKYENADWSDEAIFKGAKDLNIDIYRRIVFNEWLPIALGQTVAARINSEPLVSINAKEDYQISNEFAVAAIRFYFSMMPNILQRQHSNDIYEQDGVSNSVLFSLMEQMFRSESLDRASKLNEFLASMLSQKAMRMDGTYAGSLIEEYTHARVPSRPNVLASDIQRGRDHGLQGYTKYLEQCEGKPINTWDDLSVYMARSEINKLKSVYDRVTDVDLIVGGISEIPAGQSTVGPTFTCILGEQFSNIRQWHYNLDSDANNLDIKLKNLTAAKLLCSTAGLKEVPRNIFLIPSNTNPLVPCADL